jgi:uncharacterized membrane protein YdjX (TVP38/TMEM64 family)
VTVARPLDRHGVTAVSRIRPVAWLAGALTVALAVYLWHGGPDVDGWAVRIKSAGPLPFFAAMTFAPVVGIPASPFYLLAGAVFGERGALPATGASILANLIIAYGLSRVALRRGLLHSLTRRLARRRADRTSRRLNPWVFATLVRAAPGPTVAMKSYTLGLSGVPIVPYILVSWPFSMTYAALLILLGDSALDGRTDGLVLATTLILALGLGVRLLHRRLQRVRALTADSPGAACEGVDE